jgi:FtsP/CotA-like multicopper oxidase with cupredoxin domain
MYTMHGAIIVLPPHDEFLDTFLAEIDFKVAILEHIFAEESDLGAESIADFEGIGYSEINYDLEDHSDSYAINSSLYNVHINGVYQPVLTVKQNEWFGLRFIQTGAQYVFQVSLHGCESRLVSRDGIYLDEALVEDVILLAPGNRADVAYRCVDVGVYPMTNVNAESLEWICEIENWVHCIQDEFMLMQINVVESDLETGDWPYDWQPPARPNYLQDLTSIPYADLNGTFELVGGFDAEDPTTPAFNEHQFHNETDYMYGISMHPFGIYEFNLTMDEGYTASHPVHIHMNHFQIVAEFIRNANDDYTGDTSGNITSLYRIGEHRDTVLLFPNRVLTVRMSTFGFTGSLVIHCHYLSHADLGMMATIAVSDGEWDQGLQNDIANFEEMDEEQDVDPVDLENEA